MSLEVLLLAAEFLDRRGRQNNTVLSAGHSLKLKKNRFRTELRQHFFSERVINLWNKLDEDTVCASSLNCFKQYIQKLYQDGSFHSLLQSI